MVTGFNFTQGSSSTTWTIPHNLDTDRVAIDTIVLNGSDYETIAPDTIEITDPNTVTVIWSSAQQGFARIIARA